MMQAAPLVAYRRAASLILRSGTPETSEAMRGVYSLMRSSMASNTVQHSTSVPSSRATLQVVESIGSTAAPSAPV